MSCNYKSVCQIAVGDILTKDCRGEPISGTVLTVEKRCDCGVFVITTDTGTFELNSFSAVLEAS